MITTRQTSTIRVSYQGAPSQSCPLAQHRHLMLGYTTNMLIILPNTGCIILSATDIRATNNIAPCVLVTPRIKRDEVRDKIWQRWTVVTPMRSAAAIITADHNFLLGNKLHVSTRRLESRPDSRAFFFRVATFATDVAFIAYTTCELRATRALCGAVATLATASTLLVRWACA